jgi:hypothetical protein
MSCALTQGYSGDCRDSMGGLKNIFVIEFNNVSAITEAAGVVTGITKAAAKKFWKYVLPRETGNMKATASANEQNGSLFFSHAVKLVLNKLQSTMRNEMLLLAKNRLLIVGEDRNGKFWLAGKTGGVLLTAGVMDTGVASGDRSGFDLDFEGQEPEALVEVDVATSATLETPGV